MHWGFIFIQYYCTLPIVLTMTDQKPQKVLKKVILLTITSSECQRDAK